jgi:hypothetical protein
MCSDYDQGLSEQGMMPAASSWRNFASAVRSLSRSKQRALPNTGQPIVSMVWQILCFGDSVPLPSPMMVGKTTSRDHIVGAMEQRAAASLDYCLPAAAGGLESRFRDFQHLAADWVNQQSMGGQEI